MKNIVLFFSLFITLLCVQATTKDVNLEKEIKGIDFFPGSWKEALELAKKEDKLIFLDAYASWCGPCKSMQKKVFPTDKVGEYFNARFINVKIDMEKGEGADLSIKYGVWAYPSLYFIDLNGEVKISAIGYHNVNQLIKLGQAALKK